METIKNLLKSIDTTNQHNRTFAGISTTLVLYFFVAPFFAWVGTLVEFFIFFAFPAVRGFLMFMTGDAGFRFRVKNNSKLIVDRLSPEKSMLAVYFTLALIKFLSFLLYVISFLPFLTTTAWMLECVLFIVAILIQIPVEFINHVLGILKKYIPVVGSYFDIILEGTLMDYLVFYIKKILPGKTLNALNALDDVIEKFDTSGSPDLTNEEKQNFFDALDTLNVNQSIIDDIKNMDSTKFDQFINLVGSKIGDVVSSAIIGMVTGKMNVGDVINQILVKLAESKKTN
jgi:hypothetical protein